MALEPVRVVLDWGPRWTLSLLDLGLACCAVEFVAASLTEGAFLRVGAQLAPTPAHANVLVVSGTLTDRTAPAVRQLYDALAEPRYVLSFGACANCGGPYWDSYVVTKGVDQIVPVDVYVPGCPPRPEALLQGLQLLQQQHAAAPPLSPATSLPHPAEHRRPL